MLMLLAMIQASAAGPDGTLITVRVLDQQGEPVSTAVVRHREEKVLHRVNTDTGEFSERVLYLEDGEELFIKKGMQLDFEVSAPGYRTKSIQCNVRRRKNVFEVPLQPLYLDPNEEKAEQIEIPMPRPRLLDK